jgi:hypothetical protein
MSKPAIRRPRKISTSNAALSKTTTGKRRAAPTPVFTPSTAAKSSQLRKTGEWNDTYDAALLAAIKAHGEGNWEDVSRFPELGGKFGPEEVHERWEIVKGPAVKGPWTRDEDVLLNKLVHRYGPKKWSVIAAHVPGRKGKQCRERWKNHLDTGVKKTPWTPAEDKLLLEVQAEVGNRWCEIAKKLPGRPENAVKNRWNSLMNRKWTQSMQKRGPNSSASYDDEGAIANMFSGASPFTMNVKDSKMGEMMRMSLTSSGGRAGAPAMGSSLHMGNDEDRSLVRNVYETLGRSGSAPTLPPTPAEGMGSKAGPGVLNNSPTQWEGGKPPRVRIDSTRIMAMTEGFLRNEMARIKQYGESTGSDAPTADAAAARDYINREAMKRNKDARNLGLSKSMGTMSSSAMMFNTSGGYSNADFNFMEGLPDGGDIDEIAWDIAGDDAAMAKMPGTYDWEMEKQTLRDSVDRMRVSGSDLFRQSLG